MVFIQSFVICTTKDGSVIIAQKILTKSEKPEKIKVSSQNFNDGKVSVEKISPQTDRISSLQSSHISFLLVSQFSEFLSTSTPVKVSKFLINKENFSYHFIFRCLYPKHTFW